MIKTTDKRTDKRHACNAMITWGQFGQIELNYGQEILYRARVINCSESGLYFESNYPLKPGITILFRTEISGWGASSSEGCECLRTISLAEVKWCRDLVKNGELYFGIGAKYPIHY